MRLGKRLKQIESMVGTGYDHIWDCCCDHGRLGARLLERRAAPQIHFVDIVPTLMAQLACNLERFYPQRDADTALRWQVHCLDVAQLPLQQYEGKHLVILAGVGGELMSELIQAIHVHPAGAAVDFLLCPVNHSYRLRQTLIALGYRRRTETLIEENQRCYEVLLVSSTEQGGTHTQPLTGVGDQIWRSAHPQQQQVAARYLEKTLTHYRAMQRGGATGADSIVAAYEAVRLG